LKNNSVRLIQSSQVILSLIDMAKEYLTKKQSIILKDCIKRQNIGKILPLNAAYAMPYGGIAYDVFLLKEAIVSAHKDDILLPSNFNELYEKFIINESILYDKNTVACIKNIESNEDISNAFELVNSLSLPVKKERKLFFSKFTFPKIDFLSNSEMQHKKEKTLILSKKISNELSNKIIVGFDVEWHEKDKDKLLEIGVSIIDNGVIKTRHLAITENKHINNEIYVPNHRDFFHFGETEWIKKEEAFLIVNEYLNKSSAIFGHAVNGDLSVLGIKNSGKNKKPIYDTQALSEILLPAITGKKFNPTALSKIVEFFDLPHEDIKFHNGGNDIHITACILNKMANHQWINEKLNSREDDISLYINEKQTASEMVITKAEKLVEIFIHQVMQKNGDATWQQIIDKNPLKSLDLLKFCDSVFNFIKDTNTAPKKMDSLFGRLYLAHKNKNEFLFYRKSIDSLLTYTLKEIQNLNIQNQESLTCFFIENKNKIQMLLEDKKLSNEITNEFISNFLSWSNKEETSKKEIDEKLER